MIITDLNVMVVGNPWKNWIFLELQTDAGITGHGEATGGLTSSPIAEQLREIRDLVVGQDPMNPRAVWEHLRKSLYFESGPALAGIEIACWDVIGRTLGTPVWQLLGGALEPRLRAYANGWYSGPRDRRGFAEAAQAVVARGYTALKFDPFGDAYRSIDPAGLREALALVEAVREAVGDDIDIMIEAHDRFTVGTAIHIGKELQAFSPFWYEAPVPSTDVAGLVEVARSQPVRVAAGERFTEAFSFAELLHPRAIDIVQPEILNCGGVQGLVNVASVASAYGAWIAPHNAQSPFTTVINAHIGAAMPSFLIQETFDDFAQPWGREIMSGGPTVRDGYVELPAGPGFGVEFDTGEMAKYPYSRQNFLRLFRPGWETRRGDRPPRPDG
jgi:galactonate dehydratase